MKFSIRLKEIFLKNINKRKFSHLIISGSVPWHELRKEAELQLKIDLANYTPILVIWDKVLLNPGKLLNGKYYTHEIESVLQDCRNSNRIIVTQISSKESFLNNQEQIQSSNEIIVNNVLRLKKAIYTNSILLE